MMLHSALITATNIFFILGRKMAFTGSINSKCIQKPSALTICFLYPLALPDFGKKIKVESVMPVGWYAVGK